MCLNGPSRSELMLEFLLERAGAASADELCPGCGGMGSRAYGSTSTWHGGIGGQQITSDVCDKCWGSGNKNRPWVSHRLLYRNRGF